MADEQLRDYVLQRADDDDALSEEARLVVLAAFGDAGDLAEVLSDDDTSQRVIDALNAPDATEEVPVGAYLASIAVQGFRGIGASVEVKLQPGPGLVVVAGRNGSGKSTLAEGLELALTGVNSRWANKKSKVWSQVWRNLHAGNPAKIRIAMVEEGSGPTVLGVDWPAGDVPVTDMKRWVQRAGQKQEDPGVLGWTDALAMHRPMLSYDELGGILEGTPSDFHDQLYKLLGLEQLTDALTRLDAEVKSLREPGATAKKARDAVKPRLAEHDDARAAAVLALIGKAKPDLDAVAPLITQSAESTAPPVWRQAAALTAPEADDIERACAALHSAATAYADAERVADVVAADRVAVLETALLFQEKHGTQPCPVCWEGTLDDDWLVRARAALADELEAAGALRTAVRRASRPSDAHHPRPRGGPATERGRRARLHRRGTGRPPGVLGPTGRRRCRASGPRRAGPDRPPYDV